MMSLVEWNHLPHAVYFAHNIAGGALDQFITVALKRAGLPQSVLSLLYCAKPIGALIAQPVAAAFADSWRSHTTVVRRCLVFASVCSVLVPIVHHLCMQAGLDAMLDASFVGFIMLVMSIARAPVGPLVDMFTLKRLGNQRSAIGSVRVWGTAAYGLVGILIGGPVRRCEWPLFIFIVFAAVELLLALPLTLMLATSHTQTTAPNQDNADKKEEEPEKKEEKTERKKPSVKDTLAEVLSSKRMIAFLVTVLGAGYCHAIFAQYATLYMVSRNDTSPDILSKAAFVKLLGEVPVLLFGRHFIQLLGARGLVLLSLGSSILRLCGLLTLQGDWLALPQLLHGGTFGAFWLVMMMFASELAPKGSEATSQAVVSVTYGGAACVISGLLNGFILEIFGYRTVFSIAIAVAAIAATVFIVAVPTGSSQTDKEKQKQE